jgi:hypothetical protein
MSVIFSFGAGNARTPDDLVQCQLLSALTLRLQCLVQNRKAFLARTNDFTLKIL